MEKILISATFIFFSLFGIAFSEDSWPGLPPDCWKTPRNVHNLRDTDYWKNNIQFEHTPLKALKEKKFSKNRGYYFVREGLQNKAVIYIYSEKDYLIKITLTDLRGINIKWINEKLLFLQPWWGRIAGTDIIYDVEKEKVIYKEDIESGHIAFQQYRESCTKVGGCQCIKIPKK